MIVSWLSVVPAILVVIMALWTRHIIFSFLIGIAAALLIVTNGSPTEIATRGSALFLKNSGLSDFKSWSLLKNSWPLSLFLFLLCISVIAILLEKTGAAYSYRLLVQRYARSIRSVQLSSLMLSMVLFIDDYFSALTVGSVMRPLARPYGLAPLKLALLVVTVAPAFSLVSPLSSWLGEIMMQMKIAGIDLGPQSFMCSDTFYVFLRSIPYLFYAWLSLIGAWYIVMRGISYGPLARYEREAAGTCFIENTPLEDKKTMLMGFIIAVGSLIGAIFFSILMYGNWWLLGGAHSLFDAVRTAPMQMVFATGGVISVVITSVFFLSRRFITVRELGACCLEAIALIVPSLAMIICAWSLGSLVRNDLHTGEYVAQFFGHFITPVYMPAACFMCGALVSTLMGSAWATIGLMLPIIVSMMREIFQISCVLSLDALPFFLPILGATLSSCIIGNHLSFMSDALIMGASATGVSSFELVHCMVWYIVPIIIAAFVGFLSLGWATAFYTPFFAWAVSVFFSLCVMIFLFEVSNYCARLKLHMRG